MLGTTLQPTHTLNIYSMHVALQIDLRLCYSILRQTDNIAQFTPSPLYEMGLFMSTGLVSLSSVVIFSEVCDV